MSSLIEKWRKVHAEYENGEERPLNSYAMTLGVYGSVVGVLTLAGRISGRKAPTVTPWDLFVMAAATHRLSRTIAKDPVTSPLRAPFTRYKGTTGPAELQEEVRGQGASHAVGELVTCPFCLSQWVATGYAAGLVFAPRFTRLAGTTLAAIAGSDWLQLGYAQLQQKAE